MREGRCDRDVFRSVVCCHLSTAFDSERRRLATDDSVLADCFDIHVFFRDSVVLRFELHTPAWSVDASNNYSISSLLEIIALTCVSPSESSCLRECQCRVLGASTQQPKVGSESGGQTRETPLREQWYVTYVKLFDKHQFRWWLILSELTETVGTQTKRSNNFRNHLSKWLRNLIINISIRNDENFQRFIYYSEIILPATYPTYVLYRVRQ